MKKIAKISAGIGMAIAISGMCLFDSTGKIFKLSIILILLGVILFGIGYAAFLYEKEEKVDMLDLHQEDFLDRDIEYINFYDESGKEIITEKKH